MYPHSAQQDTNHDENQDIVVSEEFLSHHPHPIARLSRFLPHVKPAVFVLVIATVIFGASLTGYVVYQHFANSYSYTQIAKSSVPIIKPSGDTLSSKAPTDKPSSSSSSTTNSPSSQKASTSGSSSGTSGSGSGTGGSSGGSSGSGTGGGSTSTGFPNASNTGVPAGTPLKTINGDYQVTTPGAVVSGLNITGSLDIAAANVTIKNTKVQCIGVTSFCVSFSANNTIFTDGEIGGGANGTTFNNQAIAVWMGGSGGSATDHQLIRANIHHVMQGPRMDGDSTLSDSYLHDMSTASGVHSESIYFSASSNMVVKHNYLGPGNTSNVWFDSQGGPAISDVTITDNYMPATGLGGGQIPSWGIGIKAGTAKTNSITVSSNVFDKGPWEVGPVQSPFSWAAFTGNTYTDGTAVNP